MAWTTRDSLLLQIRIGLGKGFRRVHGMRRKLSLQEEKSIAQAICEHLEMANWKIELGPPLEAHGMSEKLRQGWRAEHPEGE